MDIKLVHAGIVLVAAAAVFHVRSLKKMHDASFSAGWDGAMAWTKTNHENLGYCPHYNPK